MSRVISKPALAVAQHQRWFERKRQLKSWAKGIEKKIAATFSHKFSNAISVTGALADAQTNPAAALITSIAGGSTDITRVGDDVNLRKLTARFTYLGNINGANGHMRIVIFWDKQPVVGSAAQWNSVMQVGATAGNAFLANPNQPNSGRFKVIYDKVLKAKDVYLSTGGTAALTQGYVTFKKKWKAKKLRWTDATATNVIGPHLYYFAMTDATANIPVHRVEMLLQFDD